MIDKQQFQRKPLTDYQRKKAIELHEAGMSNKAIARQLGYGSDLVIRQLFTTKKKSKTIANKTPSVLHHVRSVPMLRRRHHPVLDHIPTKTELYTMLHDAVRNTRC